MENLDLENSIKEIIVNKDDFIIKIEKVLNVIHIEAIHKKNEKYVFSEIQKNEKCVLSEIQLLKILNKILSYKDLAGIKFINFNFEEIDFNDKIVKLHKDLDIFYEKCKFKNYEFSYFVFKKVIAFNDCVFTSVVSFEHCVFFEFFSFQDCKVKKKVNFSVTKFEKNAYFNNTEFLGYVDFHETEFNAVAGFYGVTFEKFINFSNAIFKDFDKINFVNLNIEKINFIDIKNAIELNYKDKLQKREIEKLNNQKKEIENIEEKIKQIKERLNSTLQKIKELKEKIKKDGKLYKNYIGFKVFKQQLKLLNIEKQKLNALVKQNKKKFRLLNNRKKIANNEFEIIKLKYKAKWANNFRDSFRIIKHSLIEIDNNLEASNFHKLELYAKEIELDYITELERYKNKNISLEISNLSEWESFARKHMEDSTASKIKKTKINIKNYKQNNDNRWKNLKYFFDFFILAFYRNTSEHHTDFIRILNFTITMIALFGIFIFISKISNLEEKVSLFMFFNILISFWLLALSYQFGNTYKNSLFLFYCLFMILPALIFIPELFFKINIINQCKIIYNNRIVITIGLFYLVILTLVIYWYKSRCFRTFTSFISYPIFFIILYFSVSIILPFANLNSQEFKTKYLENNISQANKTEIIELASIINPEFNTTKNPNSSENLSISELNEYKKFIVENKEILKDSNATNEKFKQAIYADSSRDKTIKCISFIYAIILGLCLYSLQKTARRNSVVPS